MNKKFVFIVLSVFLTVLITACGQQKTSSQQQTPIMRKTLAVGSSLSENETGMVSENGTQPEEAEPVETSTQSQVPQTSQQTAVFGGFTYTIVDSGQDGCYSDQSAITCPSEGEAFYGQDAQYQGELPAYKDNADGTITDLNTRPDVAADPGPQRRWGDQQQ